MKLKIRKELIVSIMGIILSSLLLGSFSYLILYKSIRVTEKINAQAHLVAKNFSLLQSLEEIYDGLNILSRSDLKTDDRLREYRKISYAVDVYRSVLESYNPPVAKSQLSDFQKQFVASAESWNKDMDKARELIEAFDALKLPNPEDLEQEMVMFRANHEVLEAQTIQMAYSGQTFSGGDEPTACRLGKWFASFYTGSKELEKTLKVAAERDRRFHETIWRIKNAMRSGKSHEALSMLLELRHHKDQILNHLNEVDMLMVREAKSRMAEFRGYLNISVSAKRKEAWSLFEQLTNGGTKSELSQGESLLAFYRTMLIVVIVLILFVVFLGARTVYLTKTVISEPLAVTSNQNQSGSKIAA